MLVALSLLAALVQAYRMMCCLSRAVRAMCAIYSDICDKYDKSNYICSCLLCLVGFAVFVQTCCAYSVEDDCFKIYA